jgi:tetrahydromethanopterin S-methyltransferase subunit F
VTGNQRRRCGMPLGVVIALLMVSILLAALIGSVALAVMPR